MINSTLKKDLKGQLSYLLAGLLRMLLCTTLSLVFWLGTCIGESDECVTLIGTTSHRKWSTPGPGVTFPFRGDQKVKSKIDSHAKISQDIFVETISVEDKE